MSKQRARQENTKTSKNRKTVKNLNLLIKHFYPFSPDLSTLTPKWSLWVHCLSHPSRKPPISHIMTLKMDPLPIFANPIYISLPAHSMTLIFRQNDITYPLLLHTISGKKAQSLYIPVLPYLAVSKNHVFCEPCSTHDPGPPHRTASR